MDHFHHHESDKILRSPESGTGLVNNSRQYAFAAVGDTANAIPADKNYLLARQSEFSAECAAILQFEDGEMPHLQSWIEKYSCFSASNLGPHVILPIVVSYEGAVYTDDTTGSFTTVRAALDAALADIFSFSILQPLTTKRCLEATAQHRLEFELDLTQPYQEFCQRWLANPAAKTGVHTDMLFLLFGAASTSVYISRQSIVEYSVGRNTNLSTPGGGRVRPSQPVGRKPNQRPLGPKSPWSAGPVNPALAQFMQRLWSEWNKSWLAK